MRGGGLAGAVDAQFAQLFLQTLPVEANGCGGAGDVPAVLFEPAAEIGDLEFALGFAEVRLGKRRAGCRAPGLASERGQGLAADDLLGQVGEANLFPAGEDEAAFERILELAKVSRPVVARQGVERFSPQARRAASEKPPPAAECLPCARAEAAARGSQRAGGRRGLRESARRRFPRADCGEWR